MSTGLLLHFDDRGVWRDDETGRPSGIPWDEIVGVGGYKLDAIVETYTVVELDHPSGHWLEMHSDWPGFVEVAAAITRRLPGIPEDWVAQLEQLAPRAAPLTVWRRVEGS